MADNLLVNRDGQTYQVDMENTKSIQDTDLLLVNRNGTTYTVAGNQISRGDFSEVVITPTSIVPEPSEQLLTAVSDIPKVGDDVPADVLLEVGINTIMRTGCRQTRTKKQITYRRPQIQYCPLLQLVNYWLLLSTYLAVDYHVKLSVVLSAFLLDL